MTALSINSANADGVGIKYSDDELGKDFVADLKSQLSAIKNQVSLLERTINERQSAVNYLQRKEEFEFFTVKKGSFKRQLESFADRVQIKTIRWTGVPKCFDWNLDSSYKVELEDTEDAIDEFLDGLPLTHQYFARDNSLNLTSTTIIQGCPDE